MREPVRRSGGVLGALALALAGCGGPRVPSTPPESDGLAAMTPRPVSTPAPTVRSTPPPTPRAPVSPRPTGTPLSSLPGLNADSFKEVLTDSLSFTCPDVNGPDELIWTCSSEGDVAVSVYGRSSESVSAMRIVTAADRRVDRLSWMRGFASLVGVDVWQWVDRNFESNKTDQVGGVWMQITHGPESDAVLISTEPGGP